MGEQEDVDGVNRQKIHVCSDGGFCEVESSEGKLGKIGPRRFSHSTSRTSGPVSWGTSNTCP